MKYITEFRNSNATRALSQSITRLAQGHKYTFMEVCGTHTMAIARFGIKDLLPENIRLLSGPGCPVCVTPNEYIDHAIALAGTENTIIATFGDMMRVPGSSSSLEKEKTGDNLIQVVYSPMDALEIAAQNRDKEVVFLSVGFETTVPTIAATLISAKQKSISNFSVLTANKTVPPALNALLTGRLKLNGFILPGHVSTIIGSKAYSPIVKNHRIPCSIAGFEPTDILESIDDLIRQNNNNDPQLSITYRRAVTDEGNTKAQEIMAEVFRPADAEWRGLGTIPHSGLILSEAYRQYDAAQKFDVAVEETREETGCICGNILQGLEDPPRCPLFGKHCTPERPVGACMVSSEGTCAAWFKYYARNDND